MKNLTMKKEKFFWYQINIRKVFSRLLSFKTVIELIVLLFIFFFAGGKTMAMEIYSNSFNANEYIPSKYTCDGADISPHLKWDKFPSNTKSFLLIMDDPDAPVGTWIHWVVYNIPKNVNEFKEGINLASIGAKSGKNSWGNNNYGGPCPPPGKPHRYFFKIYALDISSDFPEGLTKKEVLEKVNSHIISNSQLIGLYKR